MPSPFLAACRGEPAEHVPVWFMRQAGRSLPEYRELRERYPMLDLIRTPELAAEVTLQPVRRLGVDAAILFSDIVVPLVAIGVDIRLEAGTGPVLDQPFRTAADLDRLRPLDPAADMAYVAEAVRLVVKESPVPLIGFAGGPFTMASYLVEGGPSRTWAHSKSLMYSEPGLWARFTAALADLSLASLRAQVEAGATAVQVFDSWVGALTPADYRRHVLPATSRIFAGLADLGVPAIHFGVGTGELLALMAEAGADVVGVDWRVPLDAARQRLGASVAVQGNLDPARCVASWEAAADGARQVLASNAGRAGHVFNLGWGVMPETDPDVLARVVDLVHREGRVDG